MSVCPFCSPDPDRVLHELPLVYVFRDGFPISPGHALVVPRRHVGSFFETTAEERAQLLAALDYAKFLVESQHAPDGWNIGINDGPAAGQTVLAPASRACSARGPAGSPRPSASRAITTGSASLRLPSASARGGRGSASSPGRASASPRPQTGPCVSTWQKTIMSQDNE